MVLPSGYDTVRHTVTLQETVCHHLLLVLLCKSSAGRLSVNSLPGAEWPLDPG